MASRARAYLENIPASRARTGIARRLSDAELEARLDGDLRTRGEVYVKQLRDDARQLAPSLGLVDEWKELDGALRIEHRAGGDHPGREAPGGLAAKIRKAKERRAEAERLDALARDAMAGAIFALEEIGLSRRGTAELVGVSFQRVQQIAASRG